MEERKDFASIQHSRLPIVAVLFCVIGILAATCKAIDMWGSVKVIPTYISYVMNILLYVSLIKFAIVDYKDPNVSEKKPFKDIMFKFCMMQLIAIIGLRMGNIWYLFLSAAALLLAYLMRADLANFDRNKIICLATLFIVFAAATVRALNPMGDDISVLSEIAEYNSLLIALKTTAPNGSTIVNLAYIFDTYSQALQWTIITGVYLFRFQDTAKIVNASTEKEIVAE